MSKPTIIYLTGFSTAGKSTIGPILANSLGFSFIDIDKAISDQESKSINEIFAEKGEAYFRRLEYEIVTSITNASNGNLVVALGGGTLENDKSYEAITNSGTLVYLKTDPKTLSKRLSNKDDRPLIKAENGSKLSQEEISNRVEMMLAKREARYAKAPISIPTDESHIGKTVESLTRQIERYLKLYGGRAEIEPLSKKRRANRSEE
ncbi:MAG: shikimate kinase [Chloroherpetonaceae bacterium]|nr:shikimate kinase [Chloroherpetonaceae bacterium]